LRDLLAPDLALLAQFFEVGPDHRQQLQDDRRRNVGHDAEGEDGQLAEVAAREQVDETEDRSLLLLEQPQQRLGIDARRGADGRRERAGDLRRLDRPRAAAAEPGGGSLPRDRRAAQGLAPARLVLRACRRAGVQHRARDRPRRGDRVLGRWQAWAEPVQGQGQAPLEAEAERAAMDRAQMAAAEADIQTKRAQEAEIQQLAQQLASMEAQRKAQMIGTVTGAVADVAGAASQVAIQSEMTNRYTDTQLQIAEKQAEAMRYGTYLNNGYTGQ